MIWLYGGHVLSPDRTDLSLSTTLREHWYRLYKEGRISLVSGLVYFRATHHSVVILQRAAHIQQISQVCHDDCISGHLSKDRTLERVRTSALWLKWKMETQMWLASCDRCQKANKATGRRCGLMQKIDN